MMRAVSWWVGVLRLEADNDTPEFQNLGGYIIPLGLWRLSSQIWEATVVRLVFEPKKFLLPARKYFSRFAGCPICMMGNDSCVTPSLVEVTKLDMYTSKRVSHTIRACSRKTWSKGPKRGRTTLGTNLSREGSLICVRNDLVAWKERRGWGRRFLIIKCV